MNKMPVIRLMFSRDKDEPEKAVLPAIIFISSNHHSFGDLRMPGFCLCAGWWDYSVTLHVIFKTK